MVHETEVHAYAYILRELTEKKDWNKEQVFTQNEIRKIKPIADQLGDTTPENVVKISEKLYYIIEAKSKRSMLKVAIKEAREDYANVINKSKLIQSVFITGIAGNENEGYVSTSQYLHNGQWITITENSSEVTGILSKTEVERILESNDPHLKDIEISEKEFLKAAEEINGILHENAIHKDARAKFISALLLALSEKTEINLDDEPMVLVDSINSRVDLILKKHKKSDFSRFIHIDKPSSEDNHVKLKTAIVNTVQVLLGLNIHAAMRSGKDVLGQFYEVFLKYGNGAKEIGIVLTPRHITRFAAEILDIQSSDLVLDPTCGTGGFLVAAFDQARKKSNDEDFEKFKRYGLYGIEEQDPVVALALVNMIFRGDGKNNIIEGNCFAKWLDSKTIDGSITAEYLKENKKGRISPITRVLMNPPFPKKKADKKEYLFVEHALKQMQHEGLLFCVIPYSCLIKRGGYLEWRKNLLKEHTLLSAITFPEDLFYPIGVHTAGIIIKKGIPHDKKNQKVFWLRALNDGRIKKKGKRLINDKLSDDLKTAKEPLTQFIKNHNTKIQNIVEFQKTSLIDFSDPFLELVPEAYLDQKDPTSSEIENGIDSLVRETVAFLIRSKREREFADADN
ncbi:MAG: HsdM family class I SAM-dependent methyltransferase [Nitrosotalea sp.]